MHKNCSYFQFSPKIGISYVQFSSYPIVQFSSPCNVNKVKLWNMQSLPINHYNYKSSFRKYERLDFEHLICAVCPWWVISYFCGSFYILISSCYRVRGSKTPTASSILWWGAHERSQVIIGIIGIMIISVVTICVSLIQLDHDLSRSWWREGQWCQC